MSHRFIPSHEMRLGSRSRTPWRLTVTVVLFLALSPIVVTAEGPIQNWTNLKGESMEARLVGYDLETKKIEFEKADGKRYPYPLVELSVPSKLAAFQSPEFQRSIKGLQPSPKFFFNVLAGYLLLGGTISILAGFPGYWGAAKLVADEGDFLFCLKAWGKVFFASLILSFLQVVLTIIEPVLSHIEAVATVRLLNPAAFFFIFVASIAVPVFITKRHFDLSTLSAFGLLILAGIFGAVLALLIYAAIGLWGYTAYQHDPAFIDRLLTDYVLRPMGLV